MLHTPPDISSQAREKHTSRPVINVRCLTTKANAYREVNSFSACGTRFYTPCIIGCQAHPLHQIHNINFYMKVFLCLRLMNIDYYSFVNNYSYSCIISSIKRAFLQKQMPLYSGTCNNENQCSLYNISGREYDCPSCSYRPSFLRPEQSPTAHGRLNAVRACVVTPVEKLRQST